MLTKNQVVKDVLSKMSESKYYSDFNVCPIKGCGTYIKQPGKRHMTRHLQRHNMIEVLDIRKKSLKIGIGR